jgi:hypothetical protein
MSKTYGNKSALKHGAFTDVVILPGEDPNELKELRAALYDEWNPEGPTEIDKVESIAMGMWRKRRFQRYLQKTLGKAVGIGDAFLRNDRVDYEQLVNVLEYIESGTLTEDNFSCLRGGQTKSQKNLLETGMTTMLPGYARSVR